MANFRRYLILFFSILATISLRAQTASGAVSENTVRHVTVIGLVNPGADYTGLFFMNGGHPSPLQVRVGSRGEKLSMAKGSKDVILAKQGTDPATGKPSYLPVVSASWPDAKAQDAVLIIGATAGSKEIKSLILDDSPTAFPVETTRVVNFTGISLLAKVNAFQGELKHASATVPIPYPDLKKLPANSMVRYPFAFAVQQAGGELVKLGSGFWEGAVGRRSLVIIQPPLEAGSTQIRIRAVVDYPVVPVTVPAAR